MIVACHASVPLSRTPTMLLLLLNDDTLALILQHCTLHRRSVRSVAASCRRLCDVARAHRSYTVRIRDEGLRQLPAISASTIGPFAGCTCLKFTLSRYNYKPLDGRSIASALAAPGRWPRLVKLDLAFPTKPAPTPRIHDEHVHRHQLADECYGDLVSRLGSLPQLREVVLEPVAPYCMVSVGAATQLTRLQLRGITTKSLEAIPDSSAASSAAQRRSIEEFYSRFSQQERRRRRRCRHHHGSGTSSSGTTTSSSSSDDDDECSSTSSSRGCLPSGLVSLDCHLEDADSATWLAHLGDCPRLQQLYIKHDRHVPRTVLDLAAQHAPGLTSLGVCYPGRWPLRTSRPRPVGPMPHRPQQQHERVPFPPLLAQLTRLQALDLSGVLQLTLDTDAAWRHFGCLLALQRVTGVHIQRPPPAGVRLPALTRLWASSLRLSGAGTRALLAACPALSSVHLEVNPLAEQQGSQISTSSSSAASSAPAVPVVSPSLEYAALMYKWGTTAEAAAAHFAATAPALAALPDLDLEWPQSDTSPHLPDFGRLTALTSLSLAGASSGGCVEGEDLLRALQPLSATLKELWLSHHSRITPHAALGLQGVLPALQRLAFKARGHQDHVLGYSSSEEGEELEQQQQQQHEEEEEEEEKEKELRLLKSQLRPGLELSVM